MVWFRSAVNGNVFEVQDEYLARQLEADGHEAHESDPRIKRAKDPKSK